VTREEAHEQLSYSVLTRSQSTVLYDANFMKLLWLLFGILGVCAVLYIVSMRLTASARRSGKLPPAGQATMADVERFARAGERISAIRCYREIHHCGLAEAKRAIDDLYPPA
jgi:ribosomal protein L7/L12